MLSFHVISECKNQRNIIYIEHIEVDSTCRGSGGFITTETIVGDVSCESGRAAIALNDGSFTIDGVKFTIE